MANLSGQTLGKYQLIERLGRGGMADVYKGYHPRLERYVAVKTLHSHLIEASDDFLPRFEREAKAVATLRHPQIVQVYDFDLEDDIYYMVMELVDGGSLSEALAASAKSGQRMPYTRIVELLQDVSAALDYAHQNHMLHRDIKPSNVLLDKDGHAYLADFGIARILGSGTQYTSTGSLIGTPHYMSPEQGAGRELTPASDVYAMGVMLYEMVTGHVPFDAETPYGIIHKHIHEPLPPARALRTDLPEAVEAVLAKALAKDPRERYQSAGELVKTLEKALSIKTEPVEAITGEPKVTQVLENPPEAPGLMARAPSLPPSEKVELKQAAIPPTMRPPALAGLDAAAELKAAAPVPVQTAGKKKTSWMWLVLLVILILVMIGRFLANSMQRQELTAGCETPESCMKQAETYLEQGNPALSLPALNRGISLVLPDNHPPFAMMVCRRGEVNMALLFKEAAVRDFELCMAWTEGDPHLEHVRVFAKEKLQELSTR